MVSSADAAVWRLRESFTSAPILRLPALGPSCSNAPLSKTSFIPAPSSVERNYDVGNQEFLAFKVALEEWQPWLEGAQHRFLCGLITRTWKTSEWPNASKLDKPDGLFSLMAYTSPCHTDLAPKILFQMLCFICLTLTSLLRCLVGQNPA